MPPTLFCRRCFTRRRCEARYPHAKLLRVDASKAEKLSGVVAVVTRDDLAGLNPYFGPGGR